MTHTHTHTHTRHTTHMATEHKHEGIAMKLLLVDRELSCQCAENVTCAYAYVQPRSSHALSLTHLTPLSVSHTYGHTLTSSHSASLHTPQKMCSADSSPCKEYSHTHTHTHTHTLIGHRMLANITTDLRMCAVGDSRRGPPYYSTAALPTEK